MKERYIANLEVGEKVEETFIIKEMEAKTAKNGKSYLHLSLGDKTGNVAAKKWDATEEEIGAAREGKVGELIRASVKVDEFNGSKQLIIGNFEYLTNKDEININDFLKAAPEKGADMYAYIMSVIDSFADLDLKKLCEKIWTERKEKLLYYPAATKNHHAEMSGLLHHMKTMAMAGEKLCQIYSGLNRDLLLAGVFLHDIEKLEEINSNEYGISDGYSFEGDMLGHIVQGIMYLEKEMTALGFTKEKKVLIEHMLLSHHYEPEFGSPKRPMFPEAEMLHYLDIMDARMYDMFEALQEVEEGEFSEKVWTLDNRKVYKVNK